MKSHTKEAVIRNDQLFVQGNAADTPIAVGSQAWFAWLAQNDKFFYQDDIGSFSARREKRRKCFYWYAYRRRTGKLHKAYLGKANDLTPTRLAEISRRLAGRKDDKNLGSGVALDASVRTAIASVRCASDESIPPTPFALTPSLFPPVLPENLIVRERLLRRMNAPIMLITAPSGFGKTTLLSQWRQDCSWPVAWASMGREHANPYAFWSLVVAALQQAIPELGQFVTMQLQSPAPPPIPQIIARLLKNFDRWRRNEPQKRLTLIIDNYQRVQSPDIDDTCQVFLDRLPQGVQVILSSQVRFAFARQRWLVNGVLGELQTDDLRLTPTEGVALLDNIIDAPLSYREKFHLALQAQGWSAGLNMLALALNEGGDVRYILTTFDGRSPYLQAFFVREVFNGQPPEVQEFLLRTSPLKNLTAPLCEAVTGMTNAAEILQRLYQRNQFVSLIDEAQGVYQYQNLFAQVLQRQLQERMPAQMPVIHRRAAAWYRENSYYSDAIQHLVAIEAWTEVADIIEQVVLDEMRRGSDHRILRWTQSLPGTVLKQHPLLLATYVHLAMQAFPGQDIEGLCRRLGLGLLSKERINLLSEHNRDFQNLWRLLELITKAIELMKQGQNERSERLLSGIVQEGKRIGFLFPVMVAGGGLATLAAGRGKLRLGESMAQDVLQWAIDQTGQLPASASIALTALAAIYYTRHELARARHYLTDAMLVDPNPTSANSPLIQHVMLAYILHAQGDNIGAHTTLEAALDLDPDATSFLSASDLNTHQALLYIREGDLRMAEQILKQERTYPLSSRQIRNSLEEKLLVEYYLVNGQYQIAEVMLTEEEARVNLFSPDITPLYRPLLLAQAYWGGNKINQAQRQLLNAIRLAQPEGAIRPFLDRGAAIIPMLSFVLTDQRLSLVNQQFIIRVLNELRNAHPEVPELTRREEAVLSTAVQITQREQELLRLLKLGLSNKEIAAQMVVTESTVRTHLRNIYDKLNVHNRVQAVTKARELKLV